MRKRFTGERYQVKVPLFDNHPMLSDNYTNASRRLPTVIKKLKTQPEIMKKYDQVIKEQLEGEVVEEVQQDQVLEPGNVNYLPHRGVVRLDRYTTKVRVVYDSSYKVFGPSLNYCLHVGPSLNPLLISGGFNMRKWNSNSASLLQSLKQDSAFSGDFRTNSKECVQFLCKVLRKSRRFWECSGTVTKMD